jgi:hypothetical protein
VSGWVVGWLATYNGQHDGAVAAPARRATLLTALLAALPILLIIVVVTAAVRFAARARSGGARAAAGRLAAWRGPRLAATATVAGAQGVVNEDGAQAAGQAHQAVQLLV